MTTIYSKMSKANVSEGWTCFWFKTRSHSADKNIKMNSSVKELDIFERI